MKNSEFVHLHTHTEGSEFDCTNKTVELVMKAREMGFPALAITDHGNVGTWIKFYKECKKKKDKKDKEIPFAPIKPILGMEGYFSSDRKGKNFNAEKGNHHIIMLAKNQEGYENLCTLSQLAFLEGQYYKPRIDFELLDKYSKGIIVSSACLNGVINRNLLTGRYNEAKKLASLFKDICGDNFYLACFFHGLDAERLILPDIFKLGNELDIMVAAEQDSHYLNKEDADTQNILMLMSQKKCFKDPKAMRHAYPELYFKSAEEMYKIFKTHPEALTNTKVIAEKIEDFLKIGGMRLPYFDTKPYLDENGKYSPEKTKQYYEKVKRGEIEPDYSKKNDFYESFKFIKQLLWHGMKSLNWDKSQIHLDAAKKEMADIEVAWENNDMDFATYFLIIWDAINYAKSEDILVGAGRGCLNENVKVLTNSGYKNIKDITIKDKVYSKDGLVHQVLNTFKYELNKNEKLIKISSYNGDCNGGLLLTEDHKIFSKKHEIIKNYKNWLKLKTPNIDEMEWNESKELSKNDWVYTPWVRRRHVSNKYFYFDLKKICDGKRLIYDGKYIAEKKFYPNAKIRQLVCDHIEFDENLLWILGKFVADGYYRKRKGCNNFISFAFNKKERQQIEFVKKGFKKLNITNFFEEHNKNKDVISLYIRSISIYKLFNVLFKDYKQTSQTKYVPRFLFSKNEKQIIAFLQGLFAGDGSLTCKNKYSYSSSSEKLIYQIKELLNIIKIPSSISNDRNNYVLRTPINFCLNGKIGYNPYQKNKNNDNLNCSYLTKDGYFSKIYSIEKINIKDKYVYDIEVKDQHNFLTSNGIVHNSAAASVVLRSLGITSTPDPLHYSTIWERFLNFDYEKSITKKDLGFKQSTIIETEDELEDLMEDRDVEEDLGGVDRWG